MGQGTVNLKRIRNLGRIEGREWVRNWIHTQPAPTGVVLVTGAAEMGKSHFLQSVSKEASVAGVVVVSLDGVYEGQTPADFLKILKSRGWTQRSGSPSNEFMAAERTHDKQIICIDHLDTLPGLQYWLQTVFVKELATQNDLLILACRGDHQGTVCLGVSQRPAVNVHLTSFTRPEAAGHLTFIGRGNSERSDYIARISHGHPALLNGLAMLEDTATIAMELRHKLSTIAHSILAEASLPGVFPGIEALSILHEANQDEISEIIDEHFPTNVYLELPRLSFIHRSAHGLAMEYGVLGILRDDFFNRSPIRFMKWCRRAIAILTQRMTGCSWVEKTHLLTLIVHNQVKYGVPMTGRDVQNDNWVMTSDVHRLRPDVARVTDGPLLHELLERHAVADGPPSFLSLEDQHTLLEAALTTSPRHVRVIRQIHDRPVAMALCLPMDPTYAVHLPKIIAKRIRSWLEPWLESDGGTSDCADTVLVPFLAASSNAEDVHPQDLWMALICSVFALLSDSESTVLLVNPECVHSGLKSLLTDVATATGNGFGAKYTTDIETYFILRHTDLRDWLNPRFNSASTQPAPSVPQVRVTRLSEEDIRDALRHFHHTNYLTEFAKDRQLHVMGETLRDLMLGFLVTEQCPLPLTRDQQRILRLTYIDRPGNTEAIANRLALSRTTYYRQLAEAHKNFAESFTIED